MLRISGAGTNLKVGGTGPERKWGAPIRRKAPGNFFLVVPLHFLALKAHSRFGERFRDGQYSLVSFLCAVLLLTMPPCPAICKSGGTCPPFPMELAPLLRIKYSTSSACFALDVHLCRFYAEFTSRKKLFAKSELRYNYVQMPDNVTVLGNTQPRAPADQRHERQLA